MLFFLLTFIHFTTASAVTCSSIKDDVNFCNNGFRYKAGNANVECAPKGDKCDVDSTSGDNNNQQKCCDPPLSTGCVVPSNALPPANGNLGTCIPGSKMGKQYEVISVNAGVVVINSNSPMSNVKVGERMTFASVDQGSPCPALGEVFVTVLDSATSFTVEKRGDGNNVPNDYVGSTAVAGCQIKRTDEESEHCWYSCNNEWTITFSANVVAAAGAAVTQNSVTAKLKDAITSGMTSAVIQVAKYVKITVGDVVIDGTTVAISKSIISARYTTKAGDRNSNYPGNPNFGFTDGSQKVCKNEKGFACQSGEVCKLGHYSQGFDSSGTSCSFCSKCTTKANGEGSACTWQQARMYSIYVEGRKYTDGCHCGAVPATQCLTATGDAAGDCYCPASVDEYTDSIYVPSVQCKSWSHTNNGVRSMYSDLVGGSDNWWGKNIGKTYGNVFENSKIGWIDNSANKDAVIQISVYEGKFHVQNIVAGGTGYVDGNTIIISEIPLYQTTVATFTVTSENGDGILTANELVATGSVNSDMFNGPTSWTTGAMPEVFQCRLALCPYEEMAAQITGTVDATESGSCNGWPGRGVEKCSQKATPPIICSESTCANGVTVPGKCYVPQYCGTFGGTCPTGSQKKHSNYEKEHECRGETCDVFDCCSSTCKLGFFDKQETCGASLQPIDHLESECNVQVDGKCLLKSCCKRTCASDFDATGKCSGGRSNTIKTGEAAKEQTCDGEQCDENECCPLYCKNLETSPCTVASQQLSKNTCSSESECNENHCCYVGCAAWAANTGGTPRTCSNPAKILKSSDWDQDRCDSNICDETKCCVDPPDCGHLQRTSAIGSSGCMCGSASSKTLCSQGKHCWDPNSDIGSNNQCLVKAKPKSCDDIPCNENEGLEKKCEGSACTCKSTDTCDKNTCCKKKSCTGDDIISGTPCMCGGSDAECAVGKYCWDGQCKQSDHPRCGWDEKTAISTICMCGGGAEGGKQCGVGKYCWSGKCTTDAPPAKCGETVTSCSDSTKNIKSWDYCGLNQKIKTCDEASCCQLPSCPGDGNTANDKKCNCESGSYSVECPIGHYCFHEHGKPTCMPKNKDSYPRQRCSAGFFGWQGNPDTCPTAFSKRETSDGHEGQAMDFRSCCRANCKDMYANCDAIDSSIPVSDDHCYPKSDGTCDQAEDCCYKTCHSWNGETCPAGTTRRSEHDRHRCHYNVCNAAECCQEPSMCEKWKNSGGTCTNEKPQHKNPDDRHHCSDDNCDADECCSELHCDGDGTTKTDQKCKCGGADCNVGQFCHDNHMCSDESKKDESNNGDDESQECTDSKAITHKDEQSDNDAGTYVSQCYDVSTNSEEDITKWTFKKGTGSCTICKDALQLRFGPKCEGAPGKDCKHCQDIIDAYKDCPKTDKEKCEDSKAITHKDYQGDDDAGTHVSQCFDVSTNSEEDATKWTFKKGTGSCTICKDALQLQFGSTCEGVPGKDCKHCQGIIDAYNDCPTTDSSDGDNTVAPKEDEIVVITQTLSITGVTAAEVCTSTGKQAIEIIIADILDVDENNVQISKCIDTTSRRSRRLLASGIDLEYQVSLPATEATAKKQSEIVDKMATLEGESAATTSVVAAVAKAAGKDIGDVTVKGSAPVVTVETDDGDWGAGELGGATTTSMATSIGVIIIGIFALH